MNLLRLADKVLRASAVVTAALSAPLFFVVGIMANDGGTLTGAAIGLSIMMFGAILIFGVVAAAFNLLGATRRLDGRRQMRVVTGIVYLVGLLGLIVDGRLIMHKLTAKPPLPSEVAADELAYPRLNPQPTWIIRIVGVLPATVPFDYFVAKYGTTATNDPACIRTNPDARAIPGAPGGYPLFHTERIQPVRDGQRYSASVVVDKFKPGPCHWELWGVSLRFKGNGDTYEPQRITPVAPDRPIGKYFDLSHQIDLWCKKALPNRVIAEICEDRHAYGLGVHPDGIPVTINFHDLDAAAK